MSKQNDRGYRQGFTILESVLFLAITGVLIVALLTGIGTSVNTQRYRDSVQSLKAYIQDQYTQITSTTNDHDSSWSCSSNAVVTQGQAGSGLARGQSDCVIVGRYIVINQGAITTESVIANQTGTSTTGNDITLLKTNYALSLSAASQETSTLEWGETIAWPVSGTGSKAPGTSRSIGILIIQSPDSGSTYTFTADSPPAPGSTSSADLIAMMVTGNNVSQGYGSTTLRGQSPVTLCIAPQNLVTSAGMAVYFQPYATNATAVESRSNDISLQLNGGVTAQNSGAPQC